MSNKKTKVYLALALVLIICSLTWFFAVFNLFGALIDQFNPLLQTLAMFLTGVINLIVIYSAFRELFIKRISKSGYYVIMAVVATLVIFNVIDVIYYFDYFFKNSTNAFKMVYFCFWNLLYIALWIYAYILLSQKKIGDSSLEPLLSGYFPRLVKKGRRIGYGIYYVFASYFLGDFLLAFIRWGNYYLEPFWYFFFLLFILVPIGNLIFSIKRKETKRFEIIDFSLTGVNILFVILYIVVAKTNYYAIENVAQNLFFIDFATSYPIGPIIIIIELITSSVLHVIHGVKIITNNQKAKTETVSETK